MAKLYGMLAILTVSQIASLASAQNPPRVIDGCVIPTPPPNGQIRWSYNQIKGVEVVYSCFSPYTLTPANFANPRSCRAGTWSSDEPLCNTPAAGICQAPANPVNGRVDWSGDAGRTLALYSCNVGYSLVGSQSSICVDGIWSPSSPPTCVGSGQPVDNTRYSLTVSLQGDASALYDLLVYVYRNGDWVLLSENTRRNIRFSQFPARITGLLAGTYAIRVDQHLVGGGKRSSSVLQTSLGGGIDFYLPVWPAEPTRVATSGQVTINLPQLPASNSAYAWWEIRWRRNGETRWMTRRIPKNSLNYVLSLLAGEYEVGVRLTGASQSSPWSIPVYVSNAATGEPNPPTNPCLSNPCQNGGVCRLQFGGSFICLCQTGFRGTTCSDEDRVLYSLSVSFSTTETDPNARYNLFIYRFDESQRRFVMYSDKSQLNLRYQAFPVTLRGLEAALHSIRIDRVRPGCNITLTVLHQQLGQPSLGGTYVPQWPQGVVLRPDASSRSIRVLLPTVPASERAKYQYYIVQRQPDEGQSEALRVPIGNTAAQLTGLDLGRHCVSVQLSGTGAPSPYSVEHCVCLQGPLTPCSPSPCANGGTCVPIASSFICQCRSPFSGRTCNQGDLGPVSPCLGVQCQNGGTCTASGQAASCNCIPGFTGPRCASRDGPCSSNPCLNNAQCADLGTRYFCVCGPGFNGDRCENNPVQADPCRTTSCQNGGRCNAVGQRAVCSCATGFTGPTCASRTNPCNSNPCENNGECFNGGSRYFCRCAQGFSGPRCQTGPVQADPCRTTSCQNGGRCNAVGQRAVCSCATGFTGPTCASRTNPCNSNPCENNGDCLNGGSRYFCRCAQGFSGPRCQTATSACASSPCQNGGRCINLGPRFLCICTSGFGGERCETVNNPCSSSPCLNSGTCSPTIGSAFSCRCAPNFGGQTCAEPLPCISSPCLNGGTCSNTAGGFSCACTSRFGGNRCQIILPCSSSPCLNGGTCSNTAGGFSCSCTSRFGGDRCQTIASSFGVILSPNTVDISGSSSISVVQCSATSSLAQPSYSWVPENGGSLPAGRFFPNKDQLIIYQAHSSDTGRYKCVIESSGQRAEGILTVVDGSAPPPPSVATNPQTIDRNPILTDSQPPTESPTAGTLPIDVQVSVQPSNVVRRPGNDTVLFCSSGVLPSGYDVGSVTWTRDNGQPLPFGRSNLFSGNTILRISNHAVSDSGIYRCTVEVFSATGQTVSNSAIASIQVTTISLRITPKELALTAGGDGLLECIVNGPVSTSDIHWSRQNSSSLSTHRGPALQLRSLTDAHTDMYCCSVDAGNGEMIQDCSAVAVGDICIAPDGKRMNVDEYRYINGSTTIREARVNPAADIIVLVDESRSMIQEHAWLADISLGLDNTLKSEGIGSGVLKNLFCLVGFAHPPEINGRVIRMKSGEVMGDAAEFNDARSEIAQDGRIEDMYAAMELGFRECELRPGMACQVIGITDEGRTPLIDSTYDTMKTALEQRGCILNVGVNEKMQTTKDGNVIGALGVSSNNDSAIELEGGNFEIIRRKGKPLSDTGHGTTHADYVKLAFENGGAAWDLNELRKGGDTSLAFTKAFIDLKVREISRQVCQLCHCEKSPTPFCTAGCLGEPPIVDAAGENEIPAGGDVEIICVPIGGTPVPELEFKGENGGPLPAGAKVIEGIDSITLVVSDVREKFCVDCVGTSLEGEHTDSHCVEVLAEPPVVDIQRVGTADGATVPKGGTITLRCDPVAGFPEPTLRWDSVPPSSQQGTDGDSLTITVSNVNSDFCIDCIGQSTSGTHSDQECVVIHELPEVSLTGSNNNQPVVSGQSVTLTCVPTAGVPNPELKFERIPENARTQILRDRVVLNVQRPAEDFCVDCIGTNSVGTAKETLCVDVTTPPEVGINGKDGPAVIGDDVLLTCVVLTGDPDPTLRWQGQLPQGAVTTEGTSTINILIPDVQESFCVDCVGENSAGRDVETRCVTVLGEPPVVDITGSNKGRPVNQGATVDLVCVPVTGTPAPALSWDPATIPANSIQRRVGGNITITLFNVQEYVCVDCVGTNAAGNHRDQECVSVVSQCPHPLNGEPVYHGQSVRNYTTIDGPTLKDFPASAVVAFVIDESGSMRGEHRWLAEGGNIAATLENNLRVRHVGDQQPNLYGLVGFGHPELLDPSRERGAVLQQCGSAQQVQAGFSRLEVDGRLEDGYSAVMTALTQLTCIQQINSRRQAGEKVACQVILVTDEGRDSLTSWEYDSVLQELKRYECVLNVVVQERFYGKRTSRSEFEDALGWSATGQAVLADAGDRYVIVSEGKPSAISGIENTHVKYVELAKATGGAAWDLEKLRTEQYRLSFTNGFIEVKVQEIRRQIIGMCYSCLCNNGTYDCTLLADVPGASTCLDPLVTSIVGTRSGQRLNEVAPGALVELDCQGFSSDGTPVVVNWLPVSTRTRLEGSRLIILNATRGQDDQYYQCRVSNDKGISGGDNFEVSVGGRRIGTTPVPTRRPIRIATLPPAPVTTQAPFVPAGFVVSSNRLSIGLGQRVELSCCKGTTSQSVLWLRPATQGGYSSLPEGVESTENTLTIRSVGQQHIGKFECLLLAGDGGSPEFASVTLAVDNFQPSRVRVESARLNQC